MYGYVCMCVCICVYVWVCMCVCVYVCACVCVCMWVRIYSCMSMHWCIACIQVCICLCACMYVYVCTYVCMYVYMHACVVCSLLEFYILATSEVMSGLVPTCDSVHRWRIYSAASLGGPGRQHHNIISHLVILSWHWANQSLFYPNNAERLARKQQVSILKSLVSIDQDLNSWLRVTQSPKTGDKSSTHLAIPSGCVSMYVSK